MTSARHHSHIQPSTDRPARPVLVKTPPAESHPHPHTRPRTRTDRFIAIAYWPSVIATSVLTLNAYVHYYFLGH